MARTPLFKRLPDAWKSLDTDGVLERYLGVLDAGFDETHDLAKAVLDFRSVDRVPDRFLALLGELVGHEWRSDKDHDWNRRRIKDAIRRYSYKGTVECIKDLVAEHGGSWCEIVDMASKVCVLNKQAKLSSGCAHFQAADYYHDGAYVLKVGPEVNLADLKADLERVRPGGERWYLRLCLQIDGSSAVTVTGAEHVSVRVGSTNANNHGLNEGVLNGGLTFRPLSAGEAAFHISVQMFGVNGGHITMSSSAFMMADTEIPMSAGGPIRLRDELAMRQADPEIQLGILMDSETITMDREDITMDMLFL